MRAAKFLMTVGVFAAAFSAASAHADVSISNKPTQNMSCDSGVCTATAAKAVLNTGDLQALLASGDVVVKTGNIAKDIDIDQPLTWASTSRLTLDAQASVTVNKQVTVSGTGALTIVTNDGGGKHGEFVIVPEHGSVQFWDLASSLIIDGNAYTLVGDIKTLEADIVANPSGFYALAKDYDAGVDGTYDSSPIDVTFGGTVQGLGNAVSNLTVQFSSDQNGVTAGLFRRVGSKGSLRSLGVSHGSIRGLSSNGDYGPIGLLTGENDGVIDHCWANGTLRFPGGDGIAIGGISGGNLGQISTSFSDTKILITGASAEIGGFVGINFGEIVYSRSQGRIVTRGTADTDVAGLVAYNAGSISNSFSMASVIDGKNNQANFCGLVGYNDADGIIVASYAAGEMMVARSGSNTKIGGLVGDDQSASNLSIDYWDLDRGVSDPSQGAGNIANDPGIVGRTDAQLKSGLPVGFDPRVWGSNPQLNSGYPYLLANLPQ